MVKPEVLEPELCSIAMYCTCCFEMCSQEKVLGLHHAAVACQGEVAAALCRELPCDGVNEVTCHCHYHLQVRLSAVTAVCHHV